MDIILLLLSMDSLSAKLQVKGKSPLGHGIDIFVAGENLLDQHCDVARTPFLTNGPPTLFRAGFRITIR
jgi:hypothetical protein